MLSVMLQVVLDVLGAMIECVEALASQRLALAPFTRQQDPSAPTAADPAPAVGHGLLRLSGHCYSNWAAPLHPCWQKVSRHQGFWALGACLVGRSHGANVGILHEDCEMAAINLHD